MIEKPKTKTSPARKPKSVTTFRERRTWSYRSSDGGGAQRNWIAASLSHQPNLSKSKFTINFSFKHEYALWTRTRREIESETGESKQWRTLQRLLSFLSLLFSFSKNFLGKQTVLRGQKVKEEGFKNFKRKSALSVWGEWNGVEARVSRRSREEEKERVRGPSKCLRKKKCASVSRLCVSGLLPHLKNLNNNPRAVVQQV